MSSFEHLDDLRRQNKELLQKLKHKTENLQRLRSDGSGKQFEGQTHGSVSDRKSARDRTPLTERRESLFNVSDDFINLTVSGNCPKVARSALCKPINITRTSNVAGEKPDR